MIAPLRTKLVQSEALLERQEKLATLGTLAAGIAHEIRNPLTSMKARLYTLGKHIKGNEGGTADANIIGGEITRLERIVQEVLQFARPSDPRLAAVRADVPLREVQALVSTSLEKQNVQLVFEPGADLRVPMDVGLIKQVVINLVRNATEAMDGGGTVTLRVRKGRAALNGQPQDVAVLEVNDTGKGIPAEVEERLFDPFFTTKESGTGLGLPIAARIVEKHGGALQYQTVVGHGTTFGIVLPLAGAYGEEGGK
jgi:signal transduction histidine kinase